MRTRGVLLIRDAIFVLGVYPSQRKPFTVRSGLEHALKAILAAMLKDWRTLCTKSIVHLQAHTCALRKHLEWFDSIGDKASSDVIRSNCISCLAYLANLYLTIAPTDYPTAPVMGSCCDVTLSTLGRLTEGMVMEQYSYFDSLLGVGKSLHACACPSNRISIDVLEESHGGIQSPNVCPSRGRDYHLGEMVEGCC